MDCMCDSLRMSWKMMGLVTESLCSNFTRGHRWVAEMAVDRPICIFRFLFWGELWFGCVVISRPGKSLRACLLSVLSFRDGWLRVYVRILVVLFDFFFCMGGAPELVLHKRCPLNSCIKGAPWILFREAAQAVVTMNMLAAMRWVLIAPRTTLLQDGRLVFPRRRLSKDNQHMLLRSTR